MALSTRKKLILKAVIESFVETAEPVGSKAIAASAGLGLSPATIRNELAELTALGYLTQPHTSAGRAPTAKGYRVFVNELMARQRLSPTDTDTINRSLRRKEQQLDKLLRDAGELISQLTQYPAYALASSSTEITVKRFDFIHIDINTFIVVALLDNNTVKNKLIHLPIPVEEAFLRRLSGVFNSLFTGLSGGEITAELVMSAERVSGDISGITAAIAGFVVMILRESATNSAYLAGTQHILEQPEYQDIDTAQKLLRYLSDSSGLMKLPTPEDGSRMKILIGPENVAEELKNSSVVVASYDIGGSTQGLIGVVGPTRMDYAKVAARLSYIANGLKFLLSGGMNAPPENEKLNE